MVNIAKIFHDKLIESKSNFPSSEEIKLKGLQLVLNN